jgi:hypothetical protein
MKTVGYVLRLPAFITLQATRIFQNLVEAIETTMTRGRG